MIFKCGVPWALFAHCQHSLDRGQRRAHKFWRENDLRFALTHAKIKFLERVEFHMRAFIARAFVGWWRWNEFLFRGSLPHLVDNAWLGSDDKRLGGTLSGVPQNAAGRADMIRLAQYVFFTLRVGKNQRIRVSGLQLNQLSL